ncbi:MAG TPA: pantetheine-phosphate adenylyltransferase [Bacteroidales bacterium]|nr:MAG: pantetheine-phosphate adenylyltransferase [Bacteroidetes bacterium GWE2_42_24]OFY30115.1 MAG: pantetheine-phosphate adenylyltransferase [Bacteroidetes bacterium GWF2_43_11]PKP17295.1 MAG: pantetheine-phosphate adenylyltransferase [Bacteroidetes bacterium HGW-Bacteroidetes-22]HAQ64837.1 pantetheine-phosphate adenylyltransferase [Bacteroidales bacterium]HBZ67926.1 pantetheine-phosphate adenylyltransferase [Bacteroidales bacterium]
MERIGVFPGSFDPITIGHYSVIKRALPLFDKIIVAIGINVDKTGFYHVDQRLVWIRKIFASEPKVAADTYTGLTVNYCDRIGAKFIIRGLRTSADFEFERGIGQINKKLGTEIETIFLLTAPEHSFISSSVVRDIIRNGGDPSQFLPPGLTF